MAQAFDRWLSEPGMRGPRKPATERQYRAHWRLYVEPVIGSLRPQGVERRHVERIRSEIVKSGVGPATVNRTLAMISALFYALARWGELPDGANPARHVDRHREQPRERFLSGTERARLSQALADAPMPEGARLALRLLALTGCRSGEIRGVTWAMVDIDRAMLRLPDSKTGAKTVPLSPQAVALLAASRPSTALPSAYVCSTETGTRYGTGLWRYWDRVRLAAGLDGVRVHDLRHSWASDAIAAGVPFTLVARAHWAPGSKAPQRYIHVGDAAQREAMAKIGDAIEQATSGPTGDTVTPFRRPA